MTTPDKHKHASPKRAGSRAAGRSTRRGGGARIAQPGPTGTPAAGLLAWFRTTQGLVVTGVLILALAFGLRLLVHGGSSPAPNPDASDGAVATPTGPGTTTYGTDWRTAAGSYRITVTPQTELVPTASTIGCIPAAAPGKTNLRFSVRIDNLSAKSVPVPVVSFGANTNASGVVRPAALTYALSTHVIEVTPLSRTGGCADAFSLGPAGRDPIARGSGVTYTGLIGGVRTPVATGLSLVVRYPEIDETVAGGVQQAEVLVPFPAFPTAR